MLAALLCNIDAAPAVEELDVYAYREDGRKNYKPKREPRDAVEKALWDTLYPPPPKVDWEEYVRRIEEEDAIIALLMVD